MAVDVFDIMRNINDTIVTITNATDQSEIINIINYFYAYNNINQYQQMELISDIFLQTKQKNN